METNLARKDWVITVALGVCTFLLYCCGSGGLEFFRHTEADRTLIGWSMLEAGNFAIPNILGTSIFTKPPLFYWLIAGAIGLFGTAGEMVVRMPSIVMASLFVMMQYIVLRKANFGQFPSFLGALFLCSCVQFARLADAAEIDMTFSFLCAAAFMSMFFSLSKVSFWLIILSYIFSALAFLTKGYPIIGFVGGITVSYYLLMYFIDKVPYKGIKIPKFIVWNCCGVAVFCLIVGTWIYFVLQQPHGQDYLSEYLLGEFRNRITESGDAGRAKGAFFYLPAVLTSSAPWSLLLLIGLPIPFLRKFSLSSYKDYFSDKNYRNFFLFNLTAFVVGVVLLSVPAGKADRYIMPLLSVIINLCLFGFIQIKNSKIPNYLYSFGKYVFIILALVCAFFPIAHFVKAEFAVYLPMIQSAKYVLILLCLCGLFACIKKSKIINVVVIILSLFAGRYVYATSYVEARNSDCSVKHFVSVINDAVPIQEPIYFEINTVQRWFAYYLKHLGRDVYILSSAVAENINSAQSDESVYIVISLNHLDNLKNKLTEVGATQSGAYEQLAHFPHKKHSVVLIKIDRQSLHLINTKQFIEWI